MAQLTAALGNETVQAITPDYQYEDDDDLTSIVNRLSETTNVDDRIDIAALYVERGRFDILSEIIPFLPGYTLSCFIDILLKREDAEQLDTFLNMWKQHHPGFCLSYYNCSLFKKTNMKSFAAEMQDTVLIDILLRHGVFFNMNKVVSSIISRPDDNVKSELINWCLANGADINKALVYACKQSSFSSVRLLLREGAKICYEYPDNCAFVAAVCNKNIKLIELLLDEADAQIDCYNNFAIRYAIRINLPDLLIFLLQRGVSFDWIDSLDKLVIDTPYYQVDKILVDQGLSPLAISKVRYIDLEESILADAIRKDMLEPINGIISCETDCWLNPLPRPTKPLTHQTIDDGSTILPLFATKWATKWARIDTAPFAPFSLPETPRPYQSD